MGIVLMLSTLAACSSDDPVNTEEVQTSEQTGEEVNTPEQIALSRGAEDALKSMNDLGMRMFEVLDSQSVCSGTANVVVSPLGASMVYGMLANGADGELLENMLNLIQLPQEQLGDLNEAANVLATKLPKKDIDVEVKLSQALWTRSIPFLTSYKQKMEETFLAGVMTGEPELINQWCAENTNGHIPNMIEPADSNLHTAVLDALYFKGIWSKFNKFNKEQTSLGAFNGTLGQTEVEMMHQKNVMRYSSKPGFYQSVGMYFGEESYIFSLILPEEGRSTLDLSTLKEGIHTNQSHSDNVELFLPKFSTASAEKTDLSEPLKAIGGSKCFTLPFCGMTDPSQPLELEDFSQRIYFQIDETGVTAASATMGGMGEIADISGEIAGPKVVRLDRPFYFFLTESSTGAILLAGHITDL